MTTNQHPQLPLALNMDQVPDWQNFYAAENQPLVDLMFRFANDDIGLADDFILVIHGATGSGKTHLLKASCQTARNRGLKTAYFDLLVLVSQDRPKALNALRRCDFIALDNIDEIAGKFDWEEQLFYLINERKLQCKKIILSSLLPVKATPFIMDDLSSRLLWGYVFGIKPFNDQSRAEFLQQLCARLGLNLEQHVAEFILMRFSRYPADLVNAVEKLSKQSLIEARPLTLPFVKQVLKI